MVIIIATSKTFVVSLFYNYCPTLAQYEHTNTVSTSCIDSVTTIAG